MVGIGKLEEEEVVAVVVVEEGVPVPTMGASPWSSTLMAMWSAPFSSDTTTGGEPYSKALSIKLLRLRCS